MRITVKAWIECAGVQVEENVPWGEDTLFTLEFRKFGSIIFAFKINTYLSFKKPDLDPTCTNLESIET